jgi:histidinol-phosphate aminotransferase
MNYTELLNPWLAEAEQYQAGHTFEALIKEFGFHRSEILRLAGNESTMGPSPYAIEAAQKSCPSQNYYDEPFAESLVELLTHEFSRKISMDNLGIVVANGMDGVITQIANLLIKPGDKVVDFTPSFSFYNFLASRMGAEVKTISRLAKESFRTNVSALKYTLDEDTKLVFLCSPNNPTGNLTSLEDIRLAAEICREKNVILFVDHAYIEYTYRKETDARELINEFPNMVIGYTFSKAYALAGARVGYGLMHKDLAQTFTKYNTPFLCAKSSIEMAKAALDDQKHLTKIVDNNNRQKKFLTNQLQSLRFKVYDTDANFLLFENDHVRAELIVQALFKSGIIIRKAPGVNEYALRVTIGTKDENARFIDELATILHI